LNIHFISGLPRSGSTLLAAILRQNPRFHAGMSSPAGSLYKLVESGFAANNEASVQLNGVQRRAALRAVIDAVHVESSAEVIFDTNRLWTARLPALEQLYPDAKVICCVRDLGWIMDSFERLYRRNPFEPSGIYGFDVNGTVYSRCVTLAAGNGPVGWSLNAMREALAGEQADRLLLIEYQELCQNPKRILSRIYEFIGEAPFVHDFQSVEYSASEFDRNLGAPGLHEVSGPVRWKQRKTILPPELFASYGRDQFWRAAA
jgi:sulfotransferase